MSLFDDSDNSPFEFSADNEYRDLADWGFVGGLFSWVSNHLIHDDDSGEEYDQADF
jgi:hypothetical protein